MADKNSKKYDSKAIKMVHAIQSGDNVKAYKHLESMVKERVAKKIESALAES